ncbi:MAG: cytochrome c oxidase subunit II [Candidatus Marinimicrobia bacterium]|nr:cytochrome c oxidase subunit II [Candidatus Neomarinimicrobiota bacterium]
MNLRFIWSRFYKSAQEKNKYLWGIWFLEPPKDISLDGWRIDNVIQYTDLVITIYFGLVVLAMLYFIIKYRSRSGHKAVYDKGDSKKHVGITLAMGLLVFFSIDVVIEGMSFRDLKEAFWNFPTGKDVIKVEVMPQQFAWNFRYAGEDGEFGTDDDLIPAQNQMHIPVNKPVIIQIAPYDVIHSFYIPNFRVKIDATPGMINTMWFQATETGNFEIACAELCGNSHYRMKGYLTVESEEDYNNWLQSLEQEGFDDDDEWDDDDDDIPSRWGWAWKEAI